MIAIREEPGQRLMLSGVPWSSYELVSRAFEDRHIRITYDRGNLEIMTLSHRHEFSKRLLGRLIETLTFVLHIRIHSGGSTTFSREVLEKGMEPDECYWIQNESLMRGRSDYDIGADPPPDLGVEIDIASSSIKRMGMYAALGVPEVWRVKRGSLTVSSPRRKRTIQGEKSQPCFPVSAHGRNTPLFARSADDRSDDIAARLPRLGTRYPGTGTHGGGEQIAEERQENREEIVASNYGGHVGRR